MDYRKVHVEVEVKFLKEGGMRPLWLIWEDGRKFEVERVRSIERRPARTGSLLVTRYTCLVRGQEKYLFFEGNRWFLEIARP